MRLLILGGTAWLGGVIARAAIEQGHDVTCLARGSSGGVPDGVQLIRADRTAPGAYDLVHGALDAVVDVSRQPGQVRSAVEALEPRCGRYVFVSSCNVYADPSTPGKGVGAQLLAPLADDVMADMSVYGEAKVACEQAVLDGFGPGRALIARCGLIGGPGDRSGRTTYWPWRFSRAAQEQGAVLVLDVAGLRTQVIDVRDLAAWIVASAQAGRHGIVNATGDAVPLDVHLATARDVTGHRGPVVAVPADWLFEHGVETWSGPRSLPLWLPLPEYAGFNDLDVSAARESGLLPRPLARTLADGLAWRTRHSAEAPAAGLTDEDERELLAGWAAAQ